MSPSVSVPGWVFQSFLPQITDSHYDTNFGDPNVPTSSSQNYSRACFILHVARPMSSILAKTVVPVLIVLLIAFSALLLKSRDIEARATLTITALISAVALHYSDMTELPPTGYLTLLDQVYILSYLLIFAATVLCIAAYRLADHGRELAARRVDQASLAGLLAAALFGGAAIIFWR